MAVPSAVLRQREKLERELGVTTEQPPVITSAPDPATPVTSSVETPPAVSAAPDAAALQARVTELEHLLRTRDGQTSAAQREANEANARAETMVAQVRALEEAVSDLTKRTETAEALAQVKHADADLPSLDDVEELSPEEVNVFGNDSVNFVKKLSKRELLAYIKPLVGKIAAMEKALARLPDLDKLPQLEKTVQSAQADAQRIKDEKFFRDEVLAYFKDFEAIRETPEWKNYITSDIPERGIKVGHLLHQYRLMHDAPAIRSILQTFYDNSKGKISLSSLAVPTKTQTEGTPLVKPKIKASEYKTKLRDFTSRRLAKPQWEAFKTEFETAMQEGRVEHDIQL